MREANPADDPAADADAVLATPEDRGYLTDGETLFHIERTLVDDPKGELLMELEDCGTLELIVCSARSVAELGLRPVKPLAPAPA
ncbi:MAG TPA: hypothetical protein VK701_04180 [Solirubrobacteraceae bacterium]|jgi:hypothetical protein|nr:hypothetical protein [Solirubrobacteraceae bacterium]